MVRVNAKKVEHAYRDWARDLHVFMFVVPDDGYNRTPLSVLPNWDVEFPPEVLDPAVRLQAWLTRGKRTVRMEVWRQAGTLVTGLYPSAGDIVTIRW